MLREPASTSDFQPKPQIVDIVEIEEVPDETPASSDSLREIVASYLTIAEESPDNFSDLATEDQAIILHADSKLIRTFTGYLKQEADLAYDALDKQLLPFNRFALFRQDVSRSDAPHIIHIIEGRLKKSQSRRIWLNLVLFILTIFSVLFTGTQLALANLSMTDPLLANSIGTDILAVLQEVWRGAPYALAIMAILIAHELGHYLMMRRHKIQGSLPYFIPAWLISPFGTFGAAIMLNDVPKNRKILLDIGAAGPIAGFIVTIPILLYGLSTATISPLLEGQLLEGNSLMYLFAKIAVLGQIYPTNSSDVLMNQLTFAGWTGILLTSLQMIPLGQLDGGHVLYSLFGKRARIAFYPILLGLIGIALWSREPAWLFYLVILFLVGRFYAVPLDAITSLNPLRKTLAMTALLIFIVTFTPIPFTVYSETATTGLNQSIFSNWSVLMTVALILVPRWWRMRR